MEISENITEDKSCEQEKQKKIEEVKVVFNFTIQEKNLKDFPISDSNEDNIINKEFVSKILECIEDDNIQTQESASSIDGSPIPKSSSFESHCPSRTSSENGAPLKNFYVGEVIWGRESKAQWYPCIIEGLNEDGKIQVKYFDAYRGMKAFLHSRNAKEFTTVEEFREQILQSRVRKAKETFSKDKLRGIEEAKQYLDFPIADRLRIYAKAHELYMSLRDVNAIIFSLECEYDLEDDEICIKEYLMTLFKALRTYDENNPKRQKIQKRPKKRDRPESPKYFCSDRLLAKTLAKLNKEDSLVSEKSIEQDEHEKEQKRVKKPKVRVRELTLHERFLTDDVNTNFEFEEAPNIEICEKCFDIEEEKTSPCSGKSCNTYLHDNCFSYISENGETKLCEKCFSSDFVESFCFSCRNGINSDDLAVYCTEGICRRTYHQECLRKNFPDCRKCPQHHCHICKSKYNTIIRCIECPAAYHPDNYCIPAGTRILSKTQVICPRHLAPGEKKKHINVSWCCICSEGGVLICCDGCPRSYHINCIQRDNFEEKESFLCDECIDGSLPTYYSVVFAKVGTSRFWPAFVMMPWSVPITVEKSRKYDRQFCIRFFGTSEFYYVTCEQVCRFDSLDMDCDTIVAKTGSRLDSAYKLAIKEAIEMENILNKEYQKPNFEKPKSYNKIQRNIIVPPVVLERRNIYGVHMCHCSRFDESPCGYRTLCINRSMYIECSSNCPAGEKCQNQNIKRGTGVDLEIIKTKMCGFGAICNNDIPVGTFIVEYVGEVIDTTEYNRRVERKNARGDHDVYFIFLQTNQYIDGEFYGNKSRFINHSCDPNCEARKVIVSGITRIGIYSTKFIKAGTEITFDYKMEYQSMKVSPCYCNSKKCTGVIGGKQMGSRKKKM